MQENANKCKIGLIWANLACVGLIYYKFGGTPLYWNAQKPPFLRCIRHHNVIAWRLSLEPIRYIGENSIIYYAWHQTIMIPIVSKGLAFVGVDVLTTYGGAGVITYKWIKMIIIIVALTVCNWCIGKLGWKFMVGK